MVRLQPCWCWLGSMGSLVKDSGARYATFDELHCNTTSLVNRLVTRLLTGYQLVEAYQHEAGIMSW